MRSDDPVYAKSKQQSPRGKSGRQKLLPDGHRFEKSEFLVGFENAFEDGRRERNEAEEGDDQENALQTRDLFGGKPLVDEFQREEKRQENRSEDGIEDQIRLENDPAVAVRGSFIVRGAVFREICVRRGAEPEIEQKQIDDGHRDRVDTIRRIPDDFKDPGGEEKAVKDIDREADIAENRPDLDVLPAFSLDVFFQSLGFRFILHARRPRNV